MLYKRSISNKLHFCILLIGPEVTAAGSVGHLTSNKHNKYMGNVHVISNLTYFLLQLSLKKQQQQTKDYTILK